MQVALKTLEGPLDRVVAVWRTSRPFVENSRGVLVHRPRQVTTYKIHRKPHTAIHYWCGGATIVTRFVSFIDEPASDALLCRICDARAVISGQPSADELLHRHVHKGRVVGIKVCCGEADHGC